jgi:hypothetical protein
MLHAVSEYGSPAHQQVSFPMLGADNELEHSFGLGAREILAQVADLSPFQTHASPAQMADD